MWQRFEFRVLLALAIALFAAVGFATVVSTFTGQTLRQRVGEAEIPGLMKRLDLEWSSTTKTDGFAGTADQQIIGTIRRVVCTADSDASADYDVTLTDEDSVDLLYGKGADLTTATTSLDFATSSGAVCGLVTLTVDNTTGTGHVIIYWD